VDCGKYERSFRQYGTSTAYLLAKLKRDRPDMVERGIITLTEHGWIVCYTSNLDWLGWGDVDHRHPPRFMAKGVPPSPYTVLAEGVAMIELKYPRLLDMFPQHLDANRSESASFLIWYLENYYRLDSLEAVDTVCDQKGDKGVDGIFVNDNNQTITIFQARISQRADRTIGDTALKEFSGTLSQFQDKASLQQLVASAGTADVAALIKNLDLISKIETHDVVGEFVTNIDIDANGLAYLKSNSNITSIGKHQLLSSYISDSRDIPKHAKAKFDIQGFQATEYIVDADTKAVIAPVKAIELVGLEGISDQSLFAYNVRGPLGRTQVNKDIVSSVNDAQRHKLFPLFHNGNTIVAKDVLVQPDDITADGYSVVNGCQSLTAFYDHRGKVTDDLRVLVKFIQIDPGSSLAEMVTRFSNNQNGVRPRDFKANHPIQIRPQNEFNSLYDGHYFYEIKRGEASGDGTIISNEDAGIWLRAFDLKEPWITHRKFEVFEDKHSDLFARPEVTADHIVLCGVILEAIEAVLPQISNTLFGKYALTRYLILFIVREILEGDETFSDISNNPAMFVRKPINRSDFKACVSTILKDVVIDLNSEIDQQDATFYYRDRLRDSRWVGDITRRVVADYTKLVTRGRISSFADEWKAKGH
jgi:hypothetical protein